MAALTAFSIGVSFVALTLAVMRIGHDCFERSRCVAKSVCFRPFLAQSSTSSPIFACLVERQGSDTWSGHGREGGMRTCHNGNAWTLDVEATP